MRVGLITYHSVPNFGANLQALAVTRLLESLGHQVVLLDYEPPQLIDKYRATVSRSQIEAHQSFCQSRLPLSPRCRSGQECTELVAGLDLDAGVSGSDVVFRLSYKLNREDTTFPNPFWLDWASGRGLGLYAIAASSMGTRFWSLPADVRRSVARRLMVFDLVSVRDFWTQAMVTGLTTGRVIPRQLPDPVFLLPDLAEVPLSPCQGGEDIGEYILVSAPSGVLPSDWVETLVARAHDRKLRVIGLPMPEGAYPDGPLDAEVRLPLDPLDWYCWIARSAGYIGVRFHPLVIAMANSVPFVSLDLYQPVWPAAIVSKSFDLSLRAGVAGRCLRPATAIRMGAAAVLDLLLSRPERYRRSARRYRERVTRMYRRLPCPLGKG